jgi:dihydroorotase
MNTIVKLLNIIEGHFHPRTFECGRLPLCMKYSAEFASALLPMPNTGIPDVRDHIVNSTLARAYRADLLRAMSDDNMDADLLLTLYLTPKTDLVDLVDGFERGDFFSGKQYPMGATTGSDEGVSGVEEMFPVYEVMQEYGIPLHMHCEMPTSVDVDVFDSEAIAIDEMLLPVLRRFPELKVTMEHITTKEAVQLVSSDEYPNLAASVTPQHLLYNRNHMLRGKLDQHLFCMPILKRKEHMEAIQDIVASGHKKFYMGTDSAPHMKEDKYACGCAGTYSAPVFVEAYTMFFQQAGALDKMQGFMSDNFCNFFDYVVPEKMQKTVVVEQVELGSRQIPNEIDGIVPLFHGQSLGLQARVLA